MSNDYVKRSLKTFFISIEGLYRKTEKINGVNVWRWVPINDGVFTAKVSVDPEDNSKAPQFEISTTLDSVPPFAIRVRYIRYM